MPLPVSQLLTRAITQQRNKIRVCRNDNISAARCKEGKGIMEKILEKKQKEMMEMIKKIEKVSTLEYLYTFIKLFLKEWD